MNKEKAVNEVQSERLVFNSRLIRSLGGKNSMVLRLNGIASSYPLLSPSIALLKMVRNRKLTGGASAYLSGYGGIKFFTMGRSVMSLNVNGQVGIGTENPAGRLHIDGPLGGSLATIRIGSSAPGNNKCAGWIFYWGI